VIDADAITMLAPLDRLGAAEAAAVMRRSAVPASKSDFVEFIVREAPLI